MSKPLVIPVAHDFTCPWCWIGLFQAKRLKAEFGVEIEWRGHELWPEELEWPQYSPAMPIPDKPPLLSRLDFLKLMDGIEVPQAERPKKMRVHAALEAVEYVKDHAPDHVDAFVEEVYRAYWERSERIGDIEVMVQLAEPHLVAGQALPLLQALEDRRYCDRVVHFDAPSYKKGIFNVPTFWIGGVRYAEQPYVVLERATRAAVEEERGKRKEESPEGAKAPTPQGRNASPKDIYADLVFPPAPATRPYTYIDMVATIDGKILSGGRSEPVVDLGSQVDHQLMKRIEAASDAVLLGAQTLRAAKKSWNPQAETRIVVSQSGDLPFDSCFFTGKPIVAMPTGPTTPTRPTSPNHAEILPFHDLEDLMAALKRKGIEKLLVLGGSALNAQLFEKGLIDEIFITIAPKIRLGQEVPTIAGGNALPRESIQNYSIVEQHQVGDEFFIRYRRNN